MLHLLTHTGLHTCMWHKNDHDYVIAAGAWTCCMPQHQKDHKTQYTLLYNGRIWTDKLLFFTTIIKTQTDWLIDVRPSSRESTEVESR